MSSQYDGPMLLLFRLNLLFNECEAAARVSIWFFFYLLPFQCLKCSVAPCFEHDLYVMNQNLMRSNVSILFIALDLPQPPCSKVSIIRKNQLQLII